MRQRVIAAPRQFDDVNYDLSLAPWLYTFFMKLSPTWNRDTNAIATERERWKIFKTKSKNVKGSENEVEIVS